MIPRLNAYPKIQSVLSVMPDKALALSSTAPPTPIQFEGGSADGSHVQRVIKAIEEAKFTGNADMAMVIGLYKDYVVQIAQKLITTLSMATSDAKAPELPPMPSINTPDAAASPMRLADDQLVLLLQNTMRRGEGGEGDTRLGAVDGSRVVLVLSGGDDVPLSFDDCSQAILPWQPPVDGWVAAFKRDAESLRSLLEPGRQLNEEVQALASAFVGKAQLQSITGKVESLLAISAVAPALAAGVTEMGEVLRRSLKQLEDATRKGGSKEDPERASALAHLLADLQHNAAQFLPDAIAARALRATGAAGARDYAAGQWLTVRSASGEWVDVEASPPRSLTAATHPPSPKGVVSIQEGTGQLFSAELGGPVKACQSGWAADVAGEAIPLHPWNHAPRELPRSDFEALRAWWMSVLRLQHSHIADALSGKRLNVLQQCVAIGMEDSGSGLERKKKNKEEEEEKENNNDNKFSSGASDAQGLSELLRTLHSERVTGGPVDVPAAVLLTGPPAAGKTSILSQVTVHSLDSEMLPILIKAQRLQARLLESPQAFAAAWNWVDAFLRLEHPAPLYRMLRQALASRRALILLDGLDEGGQARERIERHVAEVLAPQGHVMLVTSRPAGLDRSRFAAFRQLRLEPLTEAQQREALTQRLGGERAEALLPYMESVPIDTETGQRISANPLMLSMIASVYEIRQGVGMPETIAELYEVASEAMLSRGGAATPELRSLLQAVFFEAHVAQRREIEDRQLNEAALGLARPEELKVIRERAAERVREAPFPPFEGRAEIGHFVEVLKKGKHMGRRGVICEVIGNFFDGRSFKIRFTDGTVSNSFDPPQLRSSGLGETGLLSLAMEQSAAEVQDACARLPAVARDTLADVRRRVAHDELPLLSLLQTEPLRLQSSHLSFQEYFAACALCDGMRLSGTPPWQWGAWWANTVKIGSGMGEKFGKGLLRAAGVEGKTLNLDAKLGNDKLVAVAAVGEMAKGLTAVR